MSFDLTDWNLRVDGDGFLDDEDCFWHSIEDFVETEVLGFCGCGCGDKLIWASEMLRCCDRDQNGDQYPEDALEKYVAKHPDRAAHILLHLFDSRGVLEHGGSVGGSWLSDAGEKICEGALSGLSQKKP